jgi:hypothetical protein
VTNDLKEEFTMWYNGIMSFLLRSPFHSAISSNTMLITWTGNKSGKTYSTPVNYLHQGELLVTTSLRRRTWWRSLRSGQEVTLLVQGKKIRAMPQVFDTDETVIPALVSFLEAMPAYARYFNITLDEQNKPLTGEVERIAPRRVVIHFIPLPPVEVETENN